MRLKYLGTAAAEGIPAAFCNCEACKKARELKGKNLRARTQALLDDKILIDFNGDTYMNFMRFGLDLSAVKHVLITHRHSDHLEPSLFATKSPGCSKNPTESDLYIYGSKDTLEAYTTLINAFQGGIYQNERIHLVEIKLFETFEIDGYKVTPLMAKHSIPSAYMFLIEKDGKSMIYGNDTGNWYEENVEYLKEHNIKLDFVGFDCTYGLVPANTYGGHMSLYDCEQQFGILKANDIVTDKTIKLVTHFAHWYMLNLEEFEALASGMNFITAYDGIEIEF